MKAKIILGLKVYIFANIIGLLIAGMIDVLSYFDNHTMPHDYIGPIIAIHALGLLVLSILGFARLFFGKKIFDN